MQGNAQIQNFLAVCTMRAFLFTDGYRGLSVRLKRCSLYALAGNCVKGLFPFFCALLHSDGKIAGTLPAHASLGQRFPL